MKVLLLVSGPPDRRYVESALRWFAGRGAQVRLLGDTDDAGDDSQLDRMAREAAVAYSLAPPAKFDAWSYLGSELVRGLRHLDSHEEAPEVLRAVLGRRMFGTPFGRRLLGRGLRWCEQAVPRAAEADAVIGAELPDLVCLVRRRNAGGSYLDYLRSASAHGIPAVLVEPGDGCGKLAAAVDAAGSRRPPRRSSPSLRDRLLRPLLAPLAARLAETDGARHVKAARQDATKRRRHLDLTERRATLAARKQQVAEARLLRSQEQAAAQDAARLVAEEALGRNYEGYLRVREWAALMNARGVDPAALTEAEKRIAEALAPLWDADRETIGRLRHWSEPMTGVTPRDYGPVPSDLSHDLRRGFYAFLKEVEPELMVPEAAALGGYGVEREGVLYNEDTMRYWHAVAALSDSAVLASFRTTASRRLVWEIGGGWGGFACQFKTICPNVTYLVTGLPAMLLVSAVYLQSVFPNARFRYFDASCPDRLWEDWEHLDFVFAPESAIPEMRPPGVELTLDIASLRMMGPSRAESHVRQSFEWGARYIYTTGPLQSEAIDAHIATAIARYYWPHPVPPRAAAVFARKKRANALAAGFSHLVGWKRMRL